MQCSEVTEGWEKGRAQCAENIVLVLMFFFLSLSLLLSGWFGFVCVCCDATGFSCG